MRTLIVGDHFVGIDLFRDAIARELGDDFGPLSEVMWAGADREEQHEAQQVMEKKGPGAVETPTEIIDTVGDAELLVVHFAPVPAEVFEAADQLKAVVVARTGVENIEIEEASQRGIAVVNIYGRNANAVAEQAIGLMLAETRDLARADAAIKAGGWPEATVSPVFELADKTIGVVGFGNVGRKLARRLTGFDVRLLVFDPYVDAETISEHGGEKVDDLARIFEEGDVVALHARLTDETERFIGRELFDLMKPTAYFINNARSRMVDYEALYEVLREERIAGAGIDVHDDEPLPDDSPWRELRNVTLSPHTAGATPECWENSAQLVAEAMSELTEHGRAENTVNARALEEHA
ncbi:MAG: 2-hydroxyacid dehydrogenase [Egibacteraceae bacterium]